MDKYDVRRYKARPGGLEKLKALNGWCQRKAKDFEWDEAFEVIFNAADGNMAEIDNIILHLTNKQKTYTRKQGMLGGPAVPSAIDIRKGENGKLELLYYSPNAELTKKGQKVKHTDGSYRKDGERRKDYKKTEDRLMDIGAEIRRMYPNADPISIGQMIQGVRSYCAMHKKNPQIVFSRIRSKILGFDDDGRVVSASSLRENVKPKGKVIVISESMARMLQEAAAPTEYKFTVKLKQFLHDLLVDPSSAQVPDVFTLAGYNRSRLVKSLISNNIIERDDKISDTDEDGQPKPATMRVKYRVPKKDFDRKIKRLYIKLFERNLPEKPIDEEACGGGLAGSTSSDSSGQFSQPTFGIQRKLMPTQVMDETTATTSVGDYEYTAPAFVDRETADRSGGKEHSVAINHIK